MSDNKKAARSHGLRGGLPRVDCLGVLSADEGTALLPSSRSSLYGRLQLGWRARLSASGPAVGDFVVGSLIFLMSRGW